MSQTTSKEVVAQLQHLRSEAKEISRIYLANLQRDIVQLIDFLNNTNGAKPQKLTPLLVQMKNELEAMDLKPEKGRRKDLRQIEKAVRAMTKAALEKKSR